MNRAKALTVLGIFLSAVFLLIGGILAWNTYKVRTGRPRQNSENLQELPVAMVQRFAEFREDNTMFSPSLPDTSIRITELTNLSNFEKEDSPFSASEKKYLSANSFVIRPNQTEFYSLNPNDPTMRSDDWTYLYQDIGGGAIFSRAPENSVFISTDYLLHVYHRLLEKELEYIEQTVFLPKLTTLSESLLSAAVTARNSAKNDAERESYDRLTAYFAVPTAILGTVKVDLKNQIVGDSVSDTLSNAQSQLDELKPQLTPESFSIAQQELRLVFDHQQLATPPLFAKPNEQEQLNITEDYTQYSPRSHYAKNAMLRAYFRSMMWYGRTNFLAKSPSLTRDAIRLTQLMSDPQRRQLWNDISSPTAFLVGESDDVGITEYQHIIQKAEITDRPLSDRQLQHAQQLITLLPKPKVMGAVVIDESVLNMSKEELQKSTQGFRLFGQRFTPDAFIFTNLTQGQEAADPATGEKLPSLTTSLFVMSAIGNPTADQYLPEWILQNAPNSQKVLADRLQALKQSFGSLTTDEWTQNLYWSWLYTLRSLFTDYHTVAGYPSFMRSPNWATKNLQTSLGSWTELKHDTLLYAKQSYAEMGAGGDEKIPPVPKGYVEPNVPFFDRLLALSKMTQEGLTAASALPQEFAGRHQTFDEALTFFRTVAVKQLANETISDEEFERLRTIGGQLDIVLRPLPNEQSIESNARAALIADVHTDVPSSQILYEATGIPDYIYVAVKDNNGTRLTKGLTFSHYEFTGPLGSRENDQSWQLKIYPPNNLPARPFWVRGLSPQ